MSSGAYGGRFHVNHPNMEQRKRPIRGVPLLESTGTVYDISSMPPAPELDHVVCCNPARALCGASVMGQDVVFGGPEQARNPCETCWNRAADGEKCGEAGCPGDG